MYHRPRTAGHVVRDPLQGLHRQKITTKADVINRPGSPQRDIPHLAGEDESIFLKIFLNVDAGDLCAVHEPAYEVRKAPQVEQLLGPREGGRSLNLLRVEDQRPVLQEQAPPARRPATRSRATFS